MDCDVLFQITLKRECSKSVIKILFSVNEKVLEKYKNENGEVASRAEYS